MELNLKENLFPRQITGNPKTKLNTMKRLLIMFLLGTLALSAQHKTNPNIVKTTVRGVVLSYDKTKHIMTLTTTPKVMYTNDTDMDVVIEINKEFALKMVLNGTTFSMTEAYFKHAGHTRDMGWVFITYRPGNCKEIKNNYVFQFTDVNPGEEYILTVSNLCDNKYETNSQNGSIVIP